MTFNSNGKLRLILSIYNSIHRENCMGSRYPYKSRNNRCGCIGLCNTWVDMTTIGMSNFCLCIIGCSYLWCSSKEKFKHLHIGWINLSTLLLITFVVNVSSTFFIILRFYWILHRINYRVDYVLFIVLLI